MRLMFPLQQLIFGVTTVKQREARAERTRDVILGKTRHRRSGVEVGCKCAEKYLVLSRS